MQSKQQEELDKLVKEVLKKQDRIIPVVGDDCFAGYIVKENGQKQMPLQQWIAEKLIGENSSQDTINKIRIEGYRGLDIMFEEYKRFNEDDGFVEFKDSVISIVEDGLEAHELFSREDVKKCL